MRRLFWNDFANPIPQWGVVNNHYDTNVTHIRTHHNESNVYKSVQSDWHVEKGAVSHTPPPLKGKSGYIILHAQITVL